MRKISSFIIRPTLLIIRCNPFGSCLFVYAGLGNAIKYSSLVIDSGKFLLSDASAIYTGNYSYYAYMWMYDQATEIIWKVGFTGTSYGGKLGQVFLNYDYSSYKPDYVPGNQALGLYDSTDLRYSTFFASVQTGYAHGLTCPVTYQISR